MDGSGVVEFTEFVKFINRSAIDKDIYLEFRVELFDISTKRQNANAVLYLFCVRTK